MSRGVGSLQRHVLDRLALGGGGLELRRRGAGACEVRPLDDWMAARGYVSSYELAQSIRGAEPTRSEQSSVQRAIRNLEKRGLVEVRWGCARLPVSEQQHEAEWAEVNRNRTAHGLPPLEKRIRGQ